MAQLLLMWVICIVILHIGCMLQAGIRGKRTGWRRELLLILILGYACFGAQLTLFRREAGSRGVMYAYLHMGNLFGDWYERASLNMHSSMCASLFPGAFCGAYGDGRIRPGEE